MLPRLKLDYVDHRADQAGWARALGVSREAIDVYLASDVIDLHIDSFIWTRIAKYNLLARHGRGPLGGWFFRQVDLPRIREAQIGGGIWSITTNPLRGARNRADVFLGNLASLRALLERVPDEVAVVRNLPEYRRARGAGKHAAWIGIQGGNALDGAEAGGDALDVIPDDLVVRITLVHLSTSRLGVTSAPMPGGPRGGGLTKAGCEYVERLNAKRIFVDLAHVGRRGFFDAVAVHDKTQPLLVTHTGVNGVHPHWRNIDDEQLRAIARTGGTVGVMYNASFLGYPHFGGSAACIVDHLEHIVDVVGDDHASLGSDWDGMVVPPSDMRTCLELPRLAQHMLDRRWTPERIGKVLGGNFLRALGALRAE